MSSAVPSLPSEFVAALPTNGLEALRQVQTGLQTATKPRRWELASLSGRLSEITSTGHTPLLSLGMSLVLQAQQSAQPVAWVAVGGSIFYPPDVAGWGIDLEALPVLRLENARAAARASDILLRSGAFGLVVLDLGSDTRVPVAMQTRLTALAKKHHAALVCLTRGRSSSLGSLVSLRGEGEVQRLGFDRFRCELRITKDKQNGPGWTAGEDCRGVEGLE